MIGVFRRFRDNARELGLVNSLMYLLDTFVGHGFRLIKYHLVAQPIPDDDLLPPRRGRSIDVRMLEPGDPSFAALGLDQRVLDYRFDQGSVCFGAFKEGAPVGCLWLVAGPYLEDEVRCRFVPEPNGKTAWDYNVYVDPEHRGGLVFARLWDTANAYLRSRGIGWSLSRILAYNADSLAAHRRLGAERLGTMVVVRIGDWQLAVSSFAPRLHVSARAESMPVYRIPAPDRG